MAHCTFTVIVSTYNSPRYLQLTLDGLARQGDPDFQCIVADDGSTAETARVIEKMRPRFRELLHSWQEDRGFRLAASRNQALTFARGSLVAFLDGDCIPSPFYVAEVKRAAARAGMDRKRLYLQGHRVILDHEVSSQLVSAEGLFTCGWRLGNAGHLGNFANAWRFPWPARPHRSLRGIRGCHMVFRLADLREVNGFDEEFQGWGHEDRDVVSRLYRLGVKRLDLRGGAVIYHLYHDEHDRTAARENLSRADDQERPVRCARGIVNRGS